eukprot:11010612-Heterocapsa_arctica.AAC.1
MIASSAIATWCSPDAARRPNHSPGIHLTSNFGWVVAVGLRTRTGSPKWKRTSRNAFLCTSSHGVSPCARTWKRLYTIAACATKNANASEFALMDTRCRSSTS